MNNPGYQTTGENILLCNPVLTGTLSDVVIEGCRAQCPYHKDSGETPLPVPQLWQ